MDDKNNNYGNNQNVVSDDLLSQQPLMAFLEEQVQGVEEQVPQEQSVNPFIGTEMMQQQSPIFEQAAMSPTPTDEVMPQESPVAEAPQQMSLTSGSINKTNYVDLDSLLPESKKAKIEPVQPTPDKPVVNNKNTNPLATLLFLIIVVAIGFAVKTFVIDGGLLVKPLYEKDEIIKYYESKYKLDLKEEDEYGDIEIYEAENDKMSVRFEFYNDHVSYINIVAKNGSVSKAYSYGLPFLKVFKDKSFLKKNLKIAKEYGKVSYLSTKYDFTLKKDGDDSYLDIHWGDDFREDKVETEEIKIVSNKEYQITNDKYKMTVKPQKEFLDRKINGVDFMSFASYDVLTFNYEDGMEIVYMLLESSTEGLEEDIKEKQYEYHDIFVYNKRKALLLGAKADKGYAFMLLARADGKDIDLSDDHKYEYVTMTVIIEDDDINLNEVAVDIKKLGEEIKIK